MRCVDPGDRALRQQGEAAPGLFSKPSGCSGMSTPPFAVRRAGGDDLTGALHSTTGGAAAPRLGTHPGKPARLARAPRGRGRRLRPARSTRAAPRDPWRRHSAVELGDAAVVLALNSSRNVGPRAHAWTGDRSSGRIVQGTRRSRRVQPDPERKPLTCEHSGCRSDYERAAPRRVTSRRSSLGRVTDRAAGRLRAAAGVGSAGGLPGRTARAGPTG
jgi:hypothetical protein